MKDREFIACELCKTMTDEKHLLENESFPCAYCKGDHNKFRPSKQFIQFLLRNNYIVRLNRTVKIILGFPGVGKTYAKEYYKCTNVHVLDSDSSNFSKDMFPDNYIDYIKQLIQEKDIDMLFISSHDSVRKAIYNDDFIMNNAAVYICYPDKSLKEDFINRYKNRGNNDNFIQLITDNWDKWIDDIEKEAYFFPLKLQVENDTLLNQIKLLTLNNII